MNSQNMNNHITGSHDPFDPSELCSRKLWELVNADSLAEITEADLQEAVEELATRRRYLSELEKLGKLKAKP
jgi:hypothetical protein